MAHKAIVAAISEVFPIEGADKIQAAKVLGETVVVSKDWNVGNIGVFLPVDVQLSEEFCHYNNLFRDKEKNKDKEKNGFFDSNRRVRAQPFMKVRSAGLFMGFDALDYAGTGISDAVKSIYKGGEAFDEVNGHKLCQKYISVEAKEKGQANKTKAAKKNYAPFFEKHVDSENFKHYSGNIREGSLLHFHAKRHGTSARMGYLPVAKELPKWKQWANKVIGFFTHAKTFEEQYFEEQYVYDYVLGTRNVVLKTGDEDKEGFHGSEQFRFDVFDLVKPHLEKGMTIYGEIAGFANGKPIMPKHQTEGLRDKAFTKKYGKEMTYTYGCKEHEYRFHVYRITTMNEDGVHIDYTQAQIDAWCEKHGLEASVEVHKPFVYDGNRVALEELVESLTERPELLTEDYIDPSHISEGIIIRVDDGKLTPSFYKSKSFAFRVCEGLCKDVDVESTN